MKTVIITGAGGNLGKTTIKKFLESDYRVIATIHNPNDIGEFKETGGLETQVVDATSETGTAAFVQQAISRYKTIDAALMLIGGYGAGTIENTGEQELQKMLKLNFYTAYNMARPVFRQMLQQSTGGRLIFMAAAPALSGIAGYPMIGYTLSKSMVLKLAKILNSEGQKKNIHCAVMAPTTIDTPENRASMPDADFSNWTKPEEIADVMEFICSSKGDKMKDVVIKM